MKIYQKYRILFIGIESIFFVYLFVAIAMAQGYRVTYQISPSMPEGWYFVAPKSIYTVGDDILFKPTDHWQKYIFDRGWAPSDKTLLLKNISAENGDSVCIKNGYLYINHQKRGKIYRYDSQGRVMPSYTICRLLNENEYFVLGVSADNSFDSRYYGIIYRDQILGKATKL